MGEKKAEREVRQETTTSTGKRVVVYKGTAGDLVKAQTMVDHPFEMQLGLASLLVEIDGSRLPVEDWRGMDLEEYMEILPLFMPGFAGTQQSLLSPLPENSDGGTKKR